MQLFILCHQSFLSFKEKFYFNFITFNCNIYLSPYSLMYNNLIPKVIPVYQLSKLLLHFMIKDTVSP